MDKKYLGNKNKINMVLLFIIEKMPVYYQEMFCILQVNYEQALRWVKCYIKNLFGQNNQILTK